MEELKAGWRKVKLGDIIEIQKGYAFKSKDFLNKGIKIIKVSNLENETINFLDCACISEENFEKYKKYALNYKDIIITTVGSWPNNKNSVVGKVVRVPQVNEKLLLNQNAIRVTTLEKYLQEYIYYALKDSKFKYYIEGVAQGSANQASITLEDIKEYELKIPSLKVRNKIASILSSLDEKIELNRKINQNLEEIAQTLFKRWFIDFEFPNEEGKPYKSSGGKMVESEVGKIPEGWRVGKLGEIVKIKNGYSYKGKELMQSENAMLTIKNFNRDGSFKIDGYKEISLGEKVKESHYVEIGDILVAHTDLTQGAEIIGNPIMVFSKANYKKIIMSMDLVKVEAKYKNFIYFLLKDKRFKNHALGYINGTTVLHLNKNCISEYKFVLPIENKLIEKLEKYLQKINLQICINQKEIEKLIELRDYLLPRLMSGEISV